MPAPLHFTTGGYTLAPFFVADPASEAGTDAPPTKPYHLYVRRHEPQIVFGSIDAGVPNAKREDGLTFLDVLWSDAPFSPHVVPLAGFGTAGPPAPPGRLTARMGSLTQLNLDWADNSGDETSFELQRQPFGGEWTTIGTLPANSTGFADSGLTPLRGYLYRVRATNGVGASAWTYEVAGETVIRPPAPGGLTAAVAGPRSIALSWMDQSSNERAFAIFRKHGGGAYARVALVAPNATSYTDWGLLPGMTYSYQVRAASDDTGGRRRHSR